MVSELKKLDDIVDIIFECIFILSNNNEKYPIINEFIVLFENYVDNQKVDLFLFYELIRLKRLINNKEVIQHLNKAIKIYE